MTQEEHDVLVALSERSDLNQTTLMRALIWLHQNDTIRVEHRLDVAVKAGKGPKGC